MRIGIIEGSDGSDGSEGKGEDGEDGEDMGFDHVCLGNGRYGVGKDVIWTCE